MQKTKRGGDAKQESCQQKMSSVLQQSGSYFTTHLTVWLLVSFSLTIFHLLSLPGLLFSTASSIRGFSILSVELPGLWSCFSEDPGQKMMITSASFLSSPARPESAESTGPRSRIICAVRSEAHSVSSLYCEGKGPSNCQMFSVIDSHRSFIPHTWHRKINISVKLAVFQRCHSLAFV